MALQTITLDHRELRQITIYVPYYLTYYGFGHDIRRSIGETAFRPWSELDRLLVQFWESRSIHPRVGCMRLGEEGQNVAYCISGLFPEMMKRRIIDLVRDPHR